jgi:hypothetical protein
MAYAVRRLRYRVDVVERPAEDERRIGLCVDCLYSGRIVSARQSVFYLCKRAATDSRFPKYPRLPVIECAGYVRRDPSSLDPT